MAQNGMFRSAMGGFNKQDVLQYIDEITAAWNTERQELEQQAEAATAAQKELSDAAQAAEYRAVEAEQKAQVVEAQLAEVQQQMYDATAILAESRTSIEELTAQLNAALKRCSELENEIAAVTNQRDDAIAAVADAREQLTARDGIEQQLEESRRQSRQQGEQITAMQQAITRYEKVLGSADSAHERMDGIVRPFLEQANRQADETLNSVQAVLAGVLAQLGELQGSVEQRRQALHRCKADSDSRLTAAFGDWLEQARGVTNPYDHHFFR